MFYVTVVSPGESSARKVEDEAFTVGRSDASNLPIPHETLSRRHLIIRQRGAKVYVEDLGSANGTFVNGERITPRAPIELDPEDQISMGDADVQLSVTIDAPTDVTAAPLEARERASTDAASDAETTLQPQAPRVAAPALMDPEFDDAPDSTWPRVLAGLGVGALAGIAFFAYRNLEKPALAPPVRQIASVPVVKLDVSYKMTYAENVQGTPGFVETYLGDEFQSRLTRDLVPAATQDWKLPPGKVIQALGISAELVKSLGEVRHESSSPADQGEAMRRLEAEANTQLAETLGSEERVRALRRLEKSLYDR